MDFLVNVIVMMIFDIFMNFDGIENGVKLWIGGELFDDNILE